MAVEPEAFDLMMFDHFVALAGVIPGSRSGGFVLWLSSPPGPGAVLGGPSLPFGDFLCRELVLLFGPLLALRRGAPLVGLRSCIEVVG